MPIRSKAEITARRAAAAASAPMQVPSVTSQRTPVVARSRVRTVVHQPAVVPVVAPSPKRRGHATKSENDKWQPTGDYEVGFGRPPEATRFRKGGKPGPGRPKGSVSHDTLLKKQLDQKKRVRINGREKNLTLRELVTTTTVMAALDGKDRDARKYVLAQSERLYPGTDDLRGAASQPTELNASDALSVEEFMADLRRELRAEIEAELAADRPDDE